MRNKVLNSLLSDDRHIVVSSLQSSLESLIIESEQERANDRLSIGMTKLGLKLSNGLPEGVSMEGLGDTLSKLWGSSKPNSSNIHSLEDSHDNVERTAALNKFLAEMNKTYLSSSWLGKQKWREDAVPAKDFSVQFEMDKKPSTDPLKSIEEHRRRLGAFASKWMAVLADTNRQVQAVYSETTRAFEATRGDNDKALEVARAGLKKLEAIPNPTDKFDGMHNTLLRNRRIDEDVVYDQVVVVEDRKSPTPAESFRPLDARSALHVAQLIKEICTNKDYFVKIERLPWLDMKDGSKFASWLRDADNNLYSKFYYTYYWQGAQDVWSDAIHDATDKYRLVSALIKWIDRSIK